MSAYEDRIKEHIQQGITKGSETGDLPGEILEQLRLAGTIITNTDGPHHYKGEIVDETFLKLVLNRRYR